MKEPAFEDYRAFLFSVGLILLLSLSGLVGSCIQRHPGNYVPGGDEGIVFPN